jgi:phage FluMu protein Com
MKGGMVFRFAARCAGCGRKLDARATGNPFGAWSIPTMEGATGKTRCTYCHDLHEGRDPQAYLPAGCVALKELTKWLASPTEKKTK